jgi:hypothetical protein
MKFRVTFKDPDGPYNCIRDEAKRQIDALTGISDEEREVLLEKRMERLNDIADRFFEHGEYVTIEIDADDTGKATATVVATK